MKQKQWGKLRKQIALILIGCMAIVFCLVDLELNHHVHQHAANETCPICKQLEGLASQLHHMMEGVCLVLFAFCQLVLVIRMIGTSSYHLINSSLVKWKVRLDD